MRTRINCVIIAAMLCAGGEPASASDLLFDEMDVVLTPTRLKQRVKDLPAGITVIEGTTLSRLGIRNVAEALRLVPGMAVAQASGNEYRVSYHGTNGLIPARMRVLVDGIPIYRSGYSIVDWSTIPVSVNEIERIEVTRSPSAASYGANAFLAVINIITRNPNDTLGVNAMAQAGSISTERASVSYGGKAGPTAYRISVVHDSNDGFDRNFKNEERRDGTDLTRVSLSTETALSNKTRLSVNTTVSDAVLQSEFADANQMTYPDINKDDFYGNLTLFTELTPTQGLRVKAHALRSATDQDWRTCYPTIMMSTQLREMYAANPSYVSAILAGQIPSGGTAQDDALAQAVFLEIQRLGGTAQAAAPICADANQDNTESQVDVELQYTNYITDRWAAVLGGSARRDGMDSETYFNGEYHYNSYRLFFTNEYRPTKYWTLNAGAMAERVDGLLKGVEVSPRASLNVHVTPHQTVRFVYSKAIRIPNILAAKRHWQYLVRNLDPTYDGDTQRYFYLTALGNDQLKPERIESREIGYYVEYPRLRFDLKVYKDELTSLISEKLQFFDFNPTNNNRVTLKGAEFQLTMRPFRGVEAYGTYAYVDNESTEYYEKSLHAKHHASAYLVWSPTSTEYVSGAIYKNSSMNGFDYERIDLTFGKAKKIGPGFFNGQLVVSRFGDTESGFVSSKTFTVINTYKDRYQYTLELGYRF